MAWRHRQLVAMLALLIPPGCLPAGPPGHPCCLLILPAVWTHPGCPSANLPG